MSYGEPAFDEAIEDLKNTEPMEILKFNPRITAMTPKNKSEIMDKNYLVKKVEEMISNKNIISSYWRDKIKDPKLNFLMMIIDDNGPNCGYKRRDILNPDMKYIGISSVEICGTFSCYIALSSSLNK